MKLSDLPILPREKLERFGADSLSDIELFCILLGSGSQQRDVYSLSKIILQEWKRGIKQSRLENISGIGPAKSSIICAAFEIARRDPRGKHITLSRAKDVHNAYAHLGYSNQEEFHVVVLNSQLERMHSECVFKGTLDAVTVHPREIFHTAIMQRGHSIILIHNHPSGKAQPSSADLEVTKICIEAGEIMGIPVLDHIIITPHDYWSYTESKE